MKAPLPLEGEGVGGWGEGAPPPDRPEDSVDRFQRPHKIKEGGVERARRLRSRPTLTESKLWDWLRLFVVRFRRQAPIGPYVVDFVCHHAKLVVEVDGGVHDLTDVALRDLKRDEWLAREGFRVIRVPARRVENDVEAVVREIAEAAGVSVPPGLAPAFTPSQPFPLEGKGFSDD